MGRAHIHYGPTISARRNKAKLANRSPVAYLYAKDEIESHIRSLKTQIWVRHQGEVATECLARLCWILGMAAEAELQAAGITPRLRVIHGALRTVHGWCLSGYTWQTDDPAGMEHAINQAHAAMMEHALHTAAAIPGAELLAAKVRAHAVSADDVAGAELYAPATDSASERAAA